MRRLHAFIRLLKLVLLCSFLCLLNCYHYETVAANTGQQNSAKAYRYHFAYTGESCSPWATAATEFLLTNNPDMQNYSVGPHISIIVYKCLWDLSAGQSFLLDTQNNQGTAEIWPISGDYEHNIPVKTGRVQINHVKRRGYITGSYNLEFSDGTSVQGKFRAAWLDMKVRCLEPIPH